MPERVVLTGCCERRRHVMYRVLDTGDGLMVEAEKYAAGRDRRTWTPQRRRLSDGSGARYGCGCGKSTLIFDKVLLADIARRVVTRLEAAYAYDR